MDAFFSRISDEALFLRMASGDKFSQEILVKRYVHLGKQIAMSLARNSGLRRVTDMDFMEAILETIDKCFRYYTIGMVRFNQYARELLTQTLSREVALMAEEQAITKEMLNLDDTLDNSDATYHEIIKDESLLTHSDLFDVDVFLENISSSSSLKKRRIARIYLLNEAGYSANEIAAKTGATKYEIRRIIENISNLVDGLDISIDYHFR